ncbi:MAG: DUF192 domain-containing protein [Blastochloris viridis]|uniref:DUF192 domain-containing protein n=1 Tax=Blastochloris viridis TaxID=1079 RepID=A0A6N4R244_BLAVI|nr:MAG: DUF192 domain-containing protein [Blastochloris viridis]
MVGLSRKSKRWALSVLMLTALSACSDYGNEAPQNLERRPLIVGNHTVSVQVADDGDERAKGLMFVREMPDKEGMLFVWPEEAARSFWMRNTYIPLDLFYIRKGEIVKVISWAKPMDESQLPSDQPVDWVLEMNGGWAERYNVGVGDKVRF